MDAPHPKLQVEWVPVRTLTLNPANPRHNDAAVPHVAASIRRFGWQQPIVAKRSGEVIAGHTRLKAAHQLGLAEVPVAWFDGSDLDAAAFGIADNRTHEFRDLGRRRARDDPRRAPPRGRARGCRLLDRRHRRAACRARGRRRWRIVRRSRTAGAARDPHDADRRPLASRQAPSPLRRLDPTGRRRPRPRRCEGRAIEISPTFVDADIVRFEKATGMFAILDGDGRTFAEIAAERTTATEGASR